jgi:hypothetical protein
MKRPRHAATFVDNHDMGDNTIVNDKLMAYSFIMVHEGYPCVFWYDYYNNGLARPLTPNGIDALIQAHHKYAGGDSQILHADPDLYIMQRVGWKDDTADQPGLIYVLNNLGDQWSGTQVKTKWANQKFVPIAWDGHDKAWPDARTTDAMATPNSLPRRAAMRSTCRPSEYTHLLRQNPRYPPRLRRIDHAPLGGDRPDRDRNRLHPQRPGDRHSANACA